MHPFNRSYDPNNPFGYQENMNPNPLPKPTQIPLTRGLLYSPCPDLAGTTSYLENRVYTNFPYDDSSIPGTASYLENRVYTNFPYDDSSIPVNLSQPDFVP
ncbi:hypothetical protein Hanom_Chr14g01270551 [Helianthus anomalus]